MPQRYGSSFSLIQDYDKNDAMLTLIFVKEIILYALFEKKIKSFDIPHPL